MSVTTGNRRRLQRARSSLVGARSRLLSWLADAAAVRVSPRFRRLSWLSVLALFLFLVQAVTGVLLSLYYYPEPGAAWESTRLILGDVPSGWLVRSFHRWAGELLLVTVMAHAAVVFFRRAYRTPREFEWVLGVLLLGAVTLFRFTGRLLPWDTIGQAATASGLRLIETVPLLGGLVAGWLRGGESLGANTLSRFFTTHVLILPWVLVVLLVLHLALVRRHGLSGDGP